MVNNSVEAYTKLSCFKAGLLLALESVPYFMSMLYWTRLSMTLSLERAIIGSRYLRMNLFDSR